jgi:hypothetical protein
MECAGFLFKMAAIRGVMVDLSGTLHIDNHVIPGSIEALKRYLVFLRPIRFLKCYLRREEQFRTCRNSLKIPAYTLRFI